MKRSMGFGLAFAVILMGCMTGVGNYASAGLAPIPGSITYNGQPRTKLTKSPIGSSFPHSFTDQWGRQVEEIYIIRPDRSLLIAERHYRPVFSLDDD
ncbi:hypothetical protein AMK06_PE00300 (plasmid) [Rhizobium sp. N541]|uniref:hypothetical protein n=1 Tax=unclassified Rhizobium TaxID=2613769 RepID=UPI0007EE49B7|nr:MULTISPECIES: hypothetical protein [unclassified Rhizobium]ANM21060.1 hypothetical protein AMK06_PE00300 [Rhizobium sp. N541]ANM27431.1 hypothetical protein AMK07_PE00300 [Rhizobium sp. N941]